MTFNRIHLNEVVVCFSVPQFYHDYYQVVSKGSKIHETQIFPNPKNGMEKELSDKKCSCLYGVFLCRELYIAHSNEIYLW